MTVIARGKFWVEFRDTLFLLVYSHNHFGRVECCWLAVELLVP